MSNYNTYYTTGEFAKLCHTTKETLFHYDKIGLLKPVKIKDNGYRYYLSQQYFQFDLIKVLQEAHLSLKEIHTFMKLRNNENFIVMLKEKNEELEREKKRIERMQYRIQQSIKMTEYGLKTIHNVPFVEECEEEHLLTIQLPSYQMSDKDMMNYISRHFEYCRQHELVEELPLGAIICKEQILKKKYHENHFYVVLDQKIDHNCYHFKEKGTYVTILHEGFYDTIGESFEKLLQFIQEHHYKIISDAYEYEIHNYFSVKSTNQYLISISIRIK